jgi:hypothetical protein
MEIEELIRRVKEINKIRCETARLAGENLLSRFGWDLNHVIKSGCGNPMEENALYIAHHHVDSAEYADNPSKELFWNSRARHMNVVGENRGVDSEADYLWEKKGRLLDRIQSGRISYEDPQVTRCMSEKAEFEMDKLREAMRQVDPVKMQETIDSAIGKYTWQLDAVRRFQKFDGTWEDYARTLE